MKTYAYFHACIHPDGRIPSLSLGHLRENGYAFWATIARGGEICCTLRSATATLAQIKFYPFVEKDRESVVLLPYINGDGPLQLWDIETEAPLVIRSRKGLQDGWDAETVRRRYPAVFRFAQSLGHWKNVQ